MALMERRGRSAGLGGALLSLVLTLFAGSYVQAQEAKVLRSGREVPAALDKIAPAGGACRRDDAVTSSTTLGSSPVAAKLDLSCARAAQEVVPILAQPASSLIDLRSTSDYLAWHAPNSINLSLADVLTKPYLRDKPLVLMGSGKLEVESYHACSRLKQEGYRQVFVVRGGILGWMQHGYATQGGSVKLSDAVNIAPAELWAGAQFAENRILLDAERASMRARLPSATVLRGDAIGIIRSIATQKVGRQKPLLGLILITSSTISEERVRDLQQAALPYPLLIYTGSEADYRAFINQQKAIWSAQARGPKTLGCGL